MKIMNRIVWGLVCAFMVLSVGCVKIWQENLDIKTYVLEASRDTPVLESPLGVKLWVDSAVVLPPYNIRGLVLRESDVEFSISYYVELLMSPAENFRNAFYAWFASSGIFSDVTLMKREGMTHRLAVTVMSFYGDTMAQTAVLKIKVSLIDENAETRTILFSKDYLQEVAVVEETTEELLRAYNKAFKQILTECETDVVDALK